MGDQRSQAERRRLFRLTGLVLVMCTAAAFAQAPSPLPTLTADQVVSRLMEKNKERAAGLQHYTGTRSYRLEYRGFPRPTDATMVVDVAFDAPGSKRFTVISSTGPKLIESRVFERLLESEEQAGDAGNRARTELGRDNYSFTLAGTDGSNYVLDVEPKQDSKFLYRGKIWVDAHDFAVTRIESQPARNPSFWTTKSLIHHTYQKVDGGFYLPKENKTVTSVRLGGTATLTIEYESYQIAPSQPAAAAKKASAFGEGATWTDGGLNVELASFANSKK